MQRLTAHISGRVQKTGYRARVLAIALDFGLKLTCKIWMMAESR